MALFGKKKKNAEKIETKSVRAARIEVLGSGCPRCMALERNVREALREAGKEKEEIAHITDPAAIAGYGVMSTPALVIDGKVVSAGTVIAPSDVKKFLGN